MSRRRIIMSLLTVLGILACPPAALASGAHLDRKFGSDGVARLPRTFGEPDGMALVGDGRVIVAGDDGITELLPTGRIDLDYGTEGVAAIPLPPKANPESAAMTGLTVDAAGRALVVGGLWEPPGAVKPLIDRFTPTGRLEQSFASDMPAISNLQQIAIDSAGRIVVKGAVPHGSEDEDFLTRLDSSGGRDLGFGRAGVRQLPEVVHYYDENTLMKAWDFEPADQIVVAIKRGAGQSLLRLAADGIRENLFGEDGFVAYPRDTYFGPIVDPDGRMITWGALEGVEHRLPNGLLIDRLMADGNPDPGFGKHGSAEVRVPQLYETDVTLDESGRILVALSLKGRGWASEPKELGLIRLRPDGRIDKSFGHRGMVRIPFPAVRYPLLSLDGIDVRGGKAAMLATDCGRDCEPVVAMIDLD